MGMDVKKYTKTYRNNVEKYTQLYSNPDPKSTHKSKPAPKSPPPPGDNGSGNEDWAPDGWPKKKKKKSKGKKK